MNLCNSCVHFLRSRYLTYTAWYLAPIVKEKLNRLLEDAKPYPWGPGKVARYRDEDMFLFGVALDRYVKHKEGPTAGLLPFLMSEVFEPLTAPDALNLVLAYFNASAV